MDEEYNKKGYKTYTFYREWAP